MSATFHVYGDESIAGNTIVYGLVIVPSERVELVETILGDVKEGFKASRCARFHCREVFHKDARRKTEWSHLTDDETYKLALTITKNLAGKGLSTRIGHVDMKDINHEISGLRGQKSMAIKDAKELIPFAYQGAAAQLIFDDKYNNRCRLWVEPNSDLVHWFGSRRQVERLLKTNSIDFDAESIVTAMTPENLDSKERPVLLELADLLAYSSARVLENIYTKRNRPSDRVTEAIYRSMNPSVGKFEQIDPSRTKEFVVHSRNDKT